MSISGSLIAVMAKAIGGLFNLFTSPKHFVYDLGKTAEEQVTDNLIGQGYRFYMCYVHDVESMKKEGWKVAVGRDEFMRPINYFDKRDELILMYQKTVKEQNFLNSRTVFAWVLLFLAFAPQMYLKSPTWTTSTELIVTTVICGLVNITYPLFITYKFRVIDFVLDDDTDKSFLEFSTWGLFWRAFVLLYVSMFATAALLALFPRMNENAPIITMMQSEVFYILGMTLTAYIFFCRRKLDTFYLLLKSIRGY